MSNPIIAQKLRRKEFFVAPGVQDMIAALMVDKVGFDVVYGSGYWLTASCLGLPDAGIATYTQMLDRMASLARTCKAALPIPGTAACSMSIIPCAATKPPE